MSAPTPLEQPVETMTGRRRLSIGLPTCLSEAEHRFPLTPEGVKALTAKGMAVRFQSGAATLIHYTDNAYSRAGAEITDRATALACDIVIHLAPLPTADIRRMRRGAMLLTLSHIESITPENIRMMQQMAIVGVAVDRIAGGHGDTALPFADILSEIDGRAAVISAAALLADPLNGKGMLLGGIAGVNPCEVTILGCGLGAAAAARSAQGLGATVRMFDNDVYALRDAARDLGPGVITSSMRERVLQSALQTADIVVVANPSGLDKVPIGADMVERMKRGVVVFDISDCPGAVFPSLPLADISATPRSPLGERRICYINAGNAVPRSAAMAMSDTFETMLDSIVTCEGLTNALKLTSGLRKGVFTFLGRVTQPDVARLCGTRYTDIDLFLQLS